MMRWIRPVPRSAGQTADLPKQKGGPGLKRRAPSAVFSSRSSVWYRAFA